MHWELTAVVAMMCGVSFAAESPLRLRPGPQLLIDDHLIESSHGLVRTTHQPEKLAEPIVVGGQAWHNIPVPYIRAIDYRPNGPFRMWYNVRDSGRGGFATYAYAESDDGIAWRRPDLGLVDVGEPNNLLPIHRGWSIVLIDDGPDAAGPKRFKFGQFSCGSGAESHGLWVSFSADGLHFDTYNKNPVAHFSEQEGVIGVSDIIDGCWDPLRKLYLICHKTHAWPSDGYKGKTKNVSEGGRRLVGQITSKDFVHWSKPRRIIVADPAEPGVWEFYGMQPQVRGDLYLGFLRVLRDDLPADPGGSVDGIGWTELCTSRDGENWTRHREPFIDRNPRKGAFDHAMAWLGECVTVGDKEYIYYGGYNLGHKPGQRVIGMATLRKNGFVSRSAGADGGTLITPPVILEATDMSVNADVRGELRIRVLDEHGKPLPGFDWRNCQPIRGDATAHRVTFKGNATALRDRAIRIEFSLKNCDLYGFDLGNPAPPGAMP